MMSTRRAVVTIALAVAIAGCGTVARLPVSATVGPQPTLLPPERALLPTVDIAKATGWAKDAHPIAAAGLAVNRFAEGLQHPRSVYVLPNGDVLVAETDAPPKPEDAKGLKGLIMTLLMKRAGSGRPSANRITLLRDADGDGVVDTRSVLLRNVNSPFGMVLVGNDLYVAATDALLRFPYQAGASEIAQPGTTVIDLPAGPLNHHWTKNVVANRDGTKLYVSVGSNSNVGENGMDKEEGRAAIWEVDVKSGAGRIYATGLRNPNGLAIEPRTGALWAAVNERDEIGGDLVPDYLTEVKDGGFYGWPYSYFGQHVDSRVTPPRPDLVAKAIVPDYALGAHTASLGLASSANTSLPDAYRNGMFVGQHGSWNRKPRSGYEVIFVPFADGRPAGRPLPVLGGFVNDDGEAQGRPVGVALDRHGALLVADDVGNSIWRVTGAGEQRAARPR